MIKIKHGWNNWDNYLSVHEKVLKNYSSNFLNTPIYYKIEKITENYFELKLDKLEVRTKQGNIILVKIEKDVVVQPGAKKKIAKTYTYSYHCWVNGPGGVINNLIRYCSPHDEHNKFHHKHDFTVKPPLLLKIAADSWPHVSEFFDEIISTF
jgi:hypothetical protein